MLQLQMNKNMIYQDNHTIKKIIIAIKNYIIQTKEKLQLLDQASLITDSSSPKTFIMQSNYIKHVIKILTILFLMFIVSMADIRIDNNELSAEGQWSMSYNPKGASAIKQSLSTEAASKNDTNKDSTVKGQEQKQPTIDELDNQESQQSNESLQEKSYQQQTGSEQILDINIFEYLRQKSGSCLVFFYDSVIADALQNKQKVDSLSIRFHDPKYLDQKIVVLKVALLNYILDTDDWEIATTKVNYTYYQNLQQKTHGSMQVAYKVEKGHISFFIDDYEVAINYKKKQYTPWFSISVLLFTFLTLYAAIRFQKRQIPVQKVSIITLYHNVFFYIYLSTFFLIVGMAALPQPMSLLLVAGCMQILISVKLIKKFQSIIQRVANLNGYCIFYCVIFIYVWLLFSYFYTPAFIIINSLFLVPQIIHNIRMGNKLGPEYEYLAILASPQVYFLYLKGYPQNLLRYHPQPLVCLAVILLVGLQFWIVYNQNIKGPFFFIKKSWLPNYYNYYHEFILDSKSELFQQECAICLCLLTELDPITASQIKGNCEILATNQLKQKGQTVNANKLENNCLGKSTIETQEDINCGHVQQIHKHQKITLMVTPCQHKFHPLCLEEWLEYKRQCPVDRKVMPFIYK